ncbi:radical SAM peptide maturase, CXXX-repeat target family [Tissierella carlieri]|uniref:radical SAM peptide maturase, CXXX-repeat target family n=1 Tax=Tissierella carlieri TaxID=689904 RepID=UPI001C11A6D1|nr:radical SAM peptide maturase, CXXX-repeat target family [Tissierella carlieri]MBU5310456.1 radical SAM peptide maturase, CXXX-repeat target family [Tissierella carlieri]
MEDCKNISLTKSPEWGGGNTQSIDFIVTEDCNLRCKYCYICHKKADKVMSFDTAKKFIDYLFSDTFTREPGAILGFIGGEPFLEVDLIDKIVDYFKMKSYISGSEWWWNYRISITTNGINYSSPSVQRFIQKNHDKLSITITIDGTKEKHDLQRVFPSGKGSYDIIAKNIPLYLSQFPGTTKVTFAHDDLPLLKESILHLWGLGINDISANVVFEDVWHDGDDEIFENQLKKLADCMIDNELYNDNYVSLFDEAIGKPLSDEHQVRPVCGAGRMVALGPSGKIYPCLRYKDYSLESDKEEIIIGDVDNGIDFNKVLRFRVSTYPMQCDDECMNCEIAVGCMFCQGQSYDSATTPTNFQRSKAICKMHKARVRANNYYFNRLYNEKNIEREDYKNEYKKMYFVLDTNFTDFCESCSDDYNFLYKEMDMSTIQAGLDYCATNFFTPVFLHSKNNLNLSLFSGFNEHRITHIVSAKFYNQLKDQKNCIFVFDKETISVNCAHQDHVILNVNWNDIRNLSTYVISLFNSTDRINLNLQGFKYDIDIPTYKRELKTICDYLEKSWIDEGPLKEFNKITDVLFTVKQTSCKTGESDFALAPNGEFFICPHEYLARGNSVGNVYERTLEVKNKHLYSWNYAPLCKNCLATHCTRCSINNKIGTGEVNVPPNYKCQPSLIEYHVSTIFESHILEVYPEIKLRKLQPFDYISPYEAYEQATQATLGFHINT